MSDQKKPAKRLTLSGTLKKDDAQPSSPDGQKSQLTLHSKVKAGQITQNIGRGKSHQVAVEIKKTRRVNLESKSAQLADGGGQALRSKQDQPKEQDMNKTRQILAEAQERMQNTPAHDDNYERLLQQKEEERQAEQERKNVQTSSKPEKETPETPVVQEAAQPEIHVESRPKQSKSFRSDEKNLDEDEVKPNRRDNAGEKRPSSGRGREENRRRQGKLTLVQALDGEDETPRVRSLASIKRARDKERKKLSESSQDERKSREVILPEMISVGDLAGRMAERAG
ncbi:MAG: translation initiation factor IF-2 associated domain-containing protein, partial [Pseudomonadota bacterium]